jgi:hypothetical protein
VTLAQHLKEQTTGTDRDDGRHFRRIGFLFSRYSEKELQRVAALAEDRDPAMVA